MACINKIIEVGYIKDCHSPSEVVLNICDAANWEWLLEMITQMALEGAEVITNASASHYTFDDLCGNDVAYLIDEFARRIGLVEQESKDLDEDGHDVVAWATAIEQALAALKTLCESHEVEKVVIYGFSLDVDRLSVVAMISVTA